MFSWFDWAVLWQKAVWWNFSLREYKALLNIEFVSVNYWITYNVKLFDLSQPYSWPIFFLMKKRRSTCWKVQAAGKVCHMRQTVACCLASLKKAVIILELFAIMVHWYYICTQVVYLSCLEKYLLFLFRFSSDIHHYILGI